MTKFKDLQATWYQKLKDSGFEDIEDKDGTIKPPAHPRTMEAAFKDQRQRETFYRIASEFLNMHLFETVGEKKIWTCYCEGLGIRRISRHLSVTKYEVEKILNKLKKLAKLERR